MSPVEIRFEVPELVFREPRVRDFVEFLEDGGVEEVAARRIVKTILSEKVLEIGARYVKSMRTHVETIMRIRAELRTRYEAVIEHFRVGKSPAELPGNLRPEAFDGLFADLEQAILDLQPAEAYVRSLPEAEVTEIRPPTAPPEALRPRWRPRAAERRLPPEEVPRPPEEVLAGMPEEAERLALGIPAEELEPSPDLGLDPLETREYRASVWAQSRAERLAYEERFVENPRVRARVRAAGARFAARHGLTERGWSWWIERTPRYGPFEAQLRALSELDPVFTAEGYALVLRRGGAGGKVYKPDGVVQSPRGGFALAEYKEPLGPQPESFYDSVEGQQKLFEDIYERALMSQELPGCAGWMYDTGAEWLDQLIYDIANERLGPELSGRILVPRAKAR
jgi:hypothetical protein